MIIWCPECKKDLFELIEERDERGLIQNQLKKLNKQKNHKSCAKCGSHLERK